MCDSECQTRKCAFSHCTLSDSSARKCKPAQLSLQRFLLHSGTLYHPRITSQVSKQAIGPAEGCRARFAPPRPLLLGPCRASNIHLAPPHRHPNTLETAAGFVTSVGGFRPYRHRHRLQVQPATEPLSLLPFVTPNAGQQPSVQAGGPVLCGADHRRGKWQWCSAWERPATAGRGLPLLLCWEHTLASRRPGCLTTFPPASCSHDCPHPALAQGTYAKVKYGQHVETGEAVAIKVGAAGC